jgi:phosphorylcholine metabolism protein LicD
MAEGYQDDFNSNVVSLKYIFCDDDEDVKKFTVEMLEKCREKSVVYKFRNKSTYSDIVIPDVVNENTGYHTACYKKYTAVGTKEVQSAIEKQLAIESQQRHALSQSASSQEEQGNSYHLTVSHT